MVVPTYWSKYLGFEHILVVVCVDHAGFLPASHVQDPSGNSQNLGAFWQEEMV